MKDFLRNISDFAPNHAPKAKLKSLQSLFKFIIILFEPSRHSKDL